MHRQPERTERTEVTTTMRVELRQDSITIDGYVNAVGRDSRELKEGGETFVEQIVPGAFGRALQENEVEIWLNHDSRRVLGSTASNLTLTEDAIGLKAHAIIKDEEVIRKARNQKLRGWSFGFIAEQEHREERPGRSPRRYIDKLKLIEVSLIDDRAVPAYEGTLVESRADGQIICYAETTETANEYTEARSLVAGHRARINKLKEAKRHEPENQKAARDESKHHLQDGGDDRQDRSGKQNVFR